MIKFGLILFCLMPLMMVVLTSAGGAASGDEADAAAGAAIDSGLEDAGGAEAGPTVGSESGAEAVVGSGADAGAEPFEAFLQRARAVPTDRRRALADSLWDSLKTTPLIEPDHRVHFLYRGEARRVTIPGDFNSWDKNAFPMFRLDGTDLWYLTRQFPPDARLDYKFVIDGRQWILDPDNPLTCTGGYGPNSELRMPAYIPPPEIEESPGIPHGTLADTSFDSRHLGNRRPIQIYLPPGYDSVNADDAVDAAEHRYPLILFHDGLEYVSLAQADRVLDYLIHHQRIEPAVAVFVPPVDRRGEYVGDRRAAFTRFIVEELIPWVDAHYRTDPRPDRRAVMGASNGGDISLWLGISHPGVFGHIGAQSTTIRDDVLDLFQNRPTQDLTLSLDLGTYDIPGIIPRVRSFIPVLEEKGYRFRYGEYPEGHSWGLWRAHIDDALEMFFPASGPFSREAESSQDAGRFEKYGAPAEPIEEAGPPPAHGQKPKENFQRAAETAGEAAARIERLIQQLQTGSPREKEAALDVFSRNYPAEMVPAVIEAVLDTTISPRHDDTGWGRIYHQAATALAGFAETVDGRTLKERGRRAYSFYDCVGTGPAKKRRAVHDRWLSWWRQAAAGMDQGGSPATDLAPENSPGATTPSPGSHLETIDRTEPSPAGPLPLKPVPDRSPFHIAPERLAALRTKADEFVAYLSGMEQAIRTELPDGELPPGLERTDWRGQLRHQQADPGFHGYSMVLWRQANGGGVVRQQVRCTVLCRGQVSLATVGPDLTIDLPARDLRLEWTIRTGQADLDKKITRIVRQRLFP
jgi:enterochelin esterase family protein